MGLIIKENKKKYKFITRNLIVMQNFKVEHYSFKQVENCKYLGVNINQRNNTYNKLRLKLVSTNREYHTMRNILSLRLLLGETNTKLYIANMCHNVIYACETWATTKGNEQKLLIFGRQILRKIYGSTLIGELQKEEE